MALPMRHLLAGSAVAGLLFILPVGAPANAQDNRNTGGWVQTGGVVLSFIAAVGGATAVSAIIWRRLSEPGAEAKRDDDKLNAVLARFDQLDGGVRALNRELTKLDTKSEERTQELDSLLKSKTDMISTDFTTLNGSIKELDAKLQECVDSEIHELTNSQNDLANKIDGLDNNLKTISQYIDGEIEKALNDLDQRYSGKPKKCEDETSHSRHF